MKAFRQARKEELAKADYERQANLRKTFQVRLSAGSRSQQRKYNGLIVSWWFISHPIFHPIRGLRDLKQQLYQQLGVYSADL